MKASLVEYICALSDNNSDVIDEIVSKKYRKFKSFFELVREYSDEIVHLKYNLSDKNVLDVVITMKGNVKKDVNLDIRKDLIKSGYSVDAEIKKRKMFIKLTYDEHIDE